ncbi:MAG: TonB-dependent receptor plug domain-containing protein, partial [Campylobacteraceae bacterium]|nr:TonB-dependent receptor plug domain-containing protein [Campylobacteraceae bacterium]
MSYLSKKAISLCLFGIVSCCMPLFADENGTQDNLTSGISQLEPIRVVGEMPTSGGGDPAVISSDYIKNAPTGTSAVTDLLRGKSYIQFDQTSRGSATGGEIAPPKVSIHGSKHYENSFLINGVGNNNNINPGGLAYSSSMQTAQPKGEAQTLFLDTSLIDSVAVYTENIGADYGGFLGGVIDAKIKDASTDRWHIGSTYRYTNDGWAKFNWTQTEESLLGNTTTAALQPEFTKYEYTLSADGPITDSLGLMLSYGKKESKIPLWSKYTNKSDGSRERRVQHRNNENFLVKLNTNDLDDLKISLTGIYAPYEHTLFIPDYRNSDYSIDSGGYTLIYDMENA